jgi:hypothetical protein
MNIFILSILIFLTVVCVIELLSYAFRTINDPDRDRVKKRLKRIYRNTQV